MRHKRLTAMLAMSALLAGCAAAPREDGGIVGTGNRIDCEEQVRKDRGRAPVPQECNREGAAPR
jgi:hypothetical protein